MNNDGAWYWVAAGVLALGLSNSLAEKQIVSFQGLPDQVQHVAEDFTANVSDQAVSVLDSAVRFSSGNQLGMDRVGIALARVQTRVACLNTAVAERQAQRARLEAERARWEAERVMVIPFEKVPCAKHFSLPKDQTPVVTVRQMPNPDTI